MHPVRIRKSLKIWEQIGYSIGWSKLTFCVIRVLLYYNGARVSHISHEEVATISNQTDAGRSTESDVDTHVAHFMVGLLECIGQSGVNFAKRWVLGQVMLSQLLLQVAFHEERKSMLEEWTHISSIWSVSVTDWEEMAMLQAHDMRVCYIRILVHLIRIVRWDSSFCREGKLRDYIYDLMWRRASSFGFFVFSCLSQFLIWVWFWRLRNSPTIQFLFLSLLLWWTCPAP